jgi:lysophospholipase L1-like esterase
VKLLREKFKGSERFLALVFFLVSGAAACAQSGSIKKENMTSMGTDEQRNASAIVYTALGDSTGVGVGARDGRGYVARLFEHISKEHSSARLHNLCVSGATTEDVLRGQLDAAISTHPTLVTLGIGINDIGHGMTIERFARNYEEIIKRLKAETKAAIVITNIPDMSFAPVIPTSQRDETRRSVQLFNEKLEAIAKRYELFVVDTYAETQRVIPAHPEFFSEDGFHPSAEGYEYWAEAMWPTVKAAIDK